MKQLSEWKTYQRLFSSGSRIAVSCYYGDDQGDILEVARMDTTFTHHLSFPVDLCYVSTFYKRQRSKHHHSVFGSSQLAYQKYLFSEHFRSLSVLVRKSLSR